MLRRRASLLLTSLVFAVLMASVSFWVLGADADVSVLRGCLFAPMPVLIELMERRRARTAVARERFEVVVRLVSGWQDGIGRGWRSGVVEPGPGVLRLRPPYGGVRFFRGSVIGLPVTSVRLTQERTRASDMWHVTPGLPVVEVGTGSAVLHVAVAWGLEQRLVERVSATAS